MRDEIDGRLWDAHGAALTESLHAFFVAVGAALARLHRWDWEAPWRGAAARRSRIGQA